ncbi:MAG: site-specific DNA-methyltransferase [Selenomonadaceae bacterium]|nr:site-specific DNA-methyltransferase [Selenomonadaceae bacterium]
MPTINFIGKDKVSKYHQQVPYKVLNHIDEKSCGESKNKIIHGDNLEVLKSLLPEYQGKIKCIYIDPPYNTGNENWIYNDNVNDPKLQKWLGQVVGREGEDFNRHDKWLCMMYPRLQLMQKLLSDDGAIFISIDDNEQANLKLICNEIFGSQNFVANMIWKNKSGGANDAKNIACDTEHILVYAKNISNLKLNRDTEAKVTTSYNKVDADGRRYSLERLDKQNLGYQPSLDFPITGTDGKIYTVEQKNPEIKLARWRWSKETVQQRYSELVFKFPYVYTKNYEKTTGTIPRNLLVDERFGRTRTGKTELKNILDDVSNFDYPKPTKLIQFLLQLATNKNSIVLDAFAGSGTTAHAVINLNQQDGGDRKFILIEQENYCDSITAERVRRIGGKFNYYELGEEIFINGKINKNISIDQLRDFIYLSETGQHSTSTEKYYLGTFEDTAYYFYYEPDQQTCLDYEFFSTLNDQATYKVIYANTSTLGKKFQSKYNLKFKSIQDDIFTFRGEKL